MPLLVSLRQYLCLIIIILYVTSIRGFRLDPEALLKTGYSHGTLLAIGASLGFLAVVAAITILHLRKTKDKPVNHPNDGNNQQIGSENPRHRALPAAPLPHYPPPPQLPSTAPQWNRAYNPSSIPVATGIYANDGGDIKTNASNQPVNLPPRASLYANSMAPPLPNKEYANELGRNGGH